MNLPQNIQAFLTEMNPYVEKTAIENGIFIITLKKSCYETPDGYFAFNKTLRALKEKYQNGTYIQQVIKSKAKDEEQAKFGVAEIVAIEQHVNVEALIVERLRAFFSPEMDFQSISDSIGFLVSQGWSDVKFQNELGVARTTLYRYKSKGKEDTKSSAFVQNGTYVIPVS